MRKLWSLPLLLLAACGPAGEQASGEPLGEVRLATTASAHDVVAIDLRVAEGGGDCAQGPFVAQEVVALAAGSIGEDGPRFGQRSFVLAPDAYLVCATPLSDAGPPALPSAICGPASAHAVVVGGATTEVLLVSPCASTGTGGVDGTVALNDAPIIDDLLITPSKFIHLCESATLGVMASDPDGDPLSYGWAVTDAPPGASPTLTPAADSATFATDTVGTYEVTVTVSDPHGGQAVESFPLHVDAEPCTPPGHVAWLLSGGTTNADEAAAAAVFANGDPLFAATFRGTIDFGFGGLTGSSEDSALLRLDGAGNLIWQTSFGGSGNEAVRDVAIDTNGDILVVGRFTGSLELGCGTQSAAGGNDGFVAKLDGTTGSCLWSHVIGGNYNDDATAVASDGAGNVVVGGIFGIGSLNVPGGSALPNAGGFDIFYLSYDAAGNHRWSHAAGSVGTEQLYDLDVTPAGEVVIVGSITSNAVTFDPGITAPAHSGEDLFLAKLSGTTGGVTDLMTPEASGNDRAKSVAFDPLGDIVLGIELGGGTLDLGQGPIQAVGGTYPIVARLQGDTLALDWATSFTGTLARLAAVATDAYGDVRVTGDFGQAITIGTTTHTAIGQPDAIYVASLDGVQGAVNWSLVGDSSGDDEARGALATDALGNTYLGGRFGNHQANDFVLGDAAAVTNVGNFDAFFAKLEP